MDPGTGNIRELEKNEQPKENEVLFQSGDELEIKGCKFKILSVRPAPMNQMVLQGIPKGGEVTEPPPPQDGPAA